MGISQRKSTVLLISIAAILVIDSDSSIVLSIQQSVFAQISAIQSQSITVNQGSSSTGSMGTSGSTGSMGTSGSTGSHCITLSLWIFTLTICY